MRKFGITFLLLTIALLVSLSFNLLSSAQNPTYRPPSATQDEMLLEEARSLFYLKKPDEALNLVRKQKDLIENQEGNWREWLDLFIEISQQKKDAPQLVLLYQFHPESFENHEDASLMVGNTLIASGKAEEYPKVREIWTDRETQLPSWTFLDADYLVATDQPGEAARLLSRRSFSGSQETNRLLRLGLLLRSEDPKRALVYFDQAVELEPKNADSRVFRAETLEDLGREEDAIREYAEVLTIEPESGVELKNRIADLFLAKGQYNSALQVLETLLTPSSPMEIWLKAFFWNKVADPIDFNWEKAKKPSGELVPYLEYLTQLPPDRFWDEKQFSRLSNQDEILATRQESYWLRLLSALQDENIKEANAILKQNLFKENSWSPQLNAALAFLLNPAQNSVSGESGEKTAKKLTVETDSDSPLFEILQKKMRNPSAELPENVAQFIQSKEIYPALLLAAGWKEAALDMGYPEALPDTTPDWFVYQLTEAIQANRDTEDALEFALKQPASPKLNLLIAELFLQEGRIDEAYARLSQLAGEKSTIGFDASTLLSAIMIEKGEYEKAKEVIRTQPRLSKDLIGKEMLARIALLQGNEEKAYQIYSGIEKRSSEAKSYLAKRAYKEQDWNRAKELTEALLEEHPDSPVLQKNLSRILEEQRKSQGR